MGKVIGIDLGTTNSVCAYLDRQDPRVIINEEGGRVTPSVVGFSRVGERFVGDIAKRQLLMNPDNTVYAVKRFMGRRFDEVQREMKMVAFNVVEMPDGGCAVPVGGRLFRPQEISAMILEKLKKNAEDFLGEKVTEAIVTVPAYFNDRQRQATKEAGSMAGLDVVRIINEPTAAALAYVHDRRKASTIAVYDFGGGTFDISLLHVERDVAEVLSTRGNNALGGTDIDDRIVHWLLEQFQEKHGIDLSGDRVVLQRLRDAAERAKIDLSGVTESEINLPFLFADASGPKHLQVVLTRQRFESMARPFFDATLEECRRVLQDAKMRPSDVDEVILVGGSSRIPRVQEMVKSLFGCPLNKSFNPDEVVAIGAAIQGAMLGGEVKAVTLLDVTNFSLGIEVEGHRMARLIPKNSTIPTSANQLVSTVADNQKVVKIHVLQGEKPLASQNTSLGEFELQGIQSAPRGIPRIDVRFAIDSDGIVNVSARDLGTGRQERIVIQTPGSVGRPSPVVGQPASRSSGANLDTLRKPLEQRLEALETILRERRDVLHRKEIVDVEMALKRGRMALTKAGDEQNLKQVLAYLSGFLEHLEERVGGSPT
ncbi:MAG: molecular chaperone DnaK [Deltaproteobacteria bacterium]|nr:molecular chaperone DnaK [Deltaproteobacteria bacterium]